MTDIDPAAAAMWLYERATNRENEEVHIALASAYRRTRTTTLGALVEAAPELVLAMYDAFCEIDDDITAMNYSDSAVADVWREMRERRTHGSTPDAEAG